MKTEIILGVVIIVLMGISTIAIVLVLKIKKRNKKIKEMERKMHLLQKEYQTMIVQVELWENRKNVIKFLDWLRNSKYHMQGFNGWNVQGHSLYYGVNSINVLEDYERTVLAQK